MKRPIMKLVDYILSHEHEDFFDNLDDQPITPYEHRLLLDWYQDNVGTTEEIKDIFQRLAYGPECSHIYASAICVSYGITPKDNP
jgi:hypothetical protein